MQTLDLPFPEQPDAVKILQPAEGGHGFFVDIDALKRILCDSEIAEKNVCVIGVAGKFRKGKSFLLNFFIRYLNYIADGSPSGQDWLEREQSLKGFPWKSGSERDTDGIVFWSKPFLVKDRNGKDLVVLLMDTQGSFDQQSSVKENATVFALSTMISSVQIYNLHSNIDEDDLGHLQLFAEYGKLALEEDSNSKPFQSLIFLVRDWSSPFEMNYGFAGGRNLLEQRLKVREEQVDYMKRVRIEIQRSFETLVCALMPHPGHSVAVSAPDFYGNLKDIPEEFKDQLRILVDSIVGPAKMSPKKINGNPVTCHELFVYFKSYAEIFSGGTLPEPKSLWWITIEANNLLAISSAREVYVTKMKAICGGDMSFVTARELELYHLEAKEEAIEHFKKAKKMGGNEYAEEFLEKLELEIMKLYEEFVKANNSKKLCKSIRTPSVLLVMLLSTLFLHEVFHLAGLDICALVTLLLLCFPIIGLATWTYSRYSGNLRNVASGLDWLFAGRLRGATGVNDIPPV